MTKNETAPVDMKWFKLEIFRSLNVCITKETYDKVLITPTDDGFSVSVDKEYYNNNGRMYVMLGLMQTRAIEQGCIAEFSTGALHISNKEE